MRSPPSTKNPIAHPPKNPMGPRNRVFTEILRYNPQIRAKTRFLCWVAGGPRNRVFSTIPRYNPQIRTKTRFLGSVGGPETGFLPKYFVTTHRFGQKPGFLDYRPPLTPSNRRKCTRPDRSPATTLTPSGKIAQQLKLESPLKLAISLPLSKSQIFRVLSLEAEIAVLPFGAIATASTTLV